jgi:hypothetical protein
MTFKSRSKAASQRHRKLIKQVGLNRKKVSEEALSLFRCALVEEQTRDSHKCRIPVLDRNTGKVTKWISSHGKNKAKCVDCVPRVAHSRAGGVKEEKAQPQVPEISRSAYDESIRAHAKELGIVVSYRVPRAEGQKKASGNFFSTNQLEQSIRNKYGSMERAGSRDAVKSGERSSGLPSTSGNAPSGNARKTATATKSEWVPTERKAPGSRSGKRKGPGAPTTPTSQHFDPCAKKRRLAWQIPGRKICKHGDGDCETFTRSGGDGLCGKHRGEAARAAGVEIPKQEGMRKACLATSRDETKKPEQPPRSSGSVELRELREYILSLGGLPLARGWKRETHARSTDGSTWYYYFNPAGVRFRSKLEAARHFGLVDAVGGKAEDTAGATEPAPQAGMRCALTDGKAWQCSDMAMPGHTRCQKHTVAKVRANENAAQMATIRRLNEQRAIRRGKKVDLAWRQSMHFHNDTKHLHVGTGLRRIFGHEKGLTAGKPSLGSLEAQQRARGTGKCKRRTPAEMEADRSADAALASAATLATVRDEEFQALWSQHTKRVLSGERVASGYAACEGNEEGGEEEGGEEGDEEGNEEGGEPRFGLDPDSTRLVDLVPGHVVDTVRRWPNRLVE